MYKQKLPARLDQKNDEWMRWRWTRRFPTETNKIWLSKFKGRTWSLVTPRNQTRQRCKRMHSFYVSGLHRTPWCTYDWIKRCHMDTGRGRASITCFPCPWVLKETSMVMENKGGGDLKDLNKWWLHGHRPLGKGEQGIWQQSQGYKSLEQRRRRILLICSIYLSSRSDAVDQNSLFPRWLPASRLMVSATKM